MTGRKAQVRASNEVHKSVDEWSPKYLERGMDGETQTTSQQTLIATNDNDFAVVLLLNPGVIRCLDPTD